MSQEPIARDLQPGETVSVAIPNAVVRFIEHDQLFIDDPAGGGMYMIPLHDGLKVAREIPADGKPKPGERWADRNGTVYYAVGTTELADRFMDIAGESHWCTAINASYGPIRRVAEAVTFTADELASIADAGES